MKGVVPRSLSRLRGFFYTSSLRSPTEGGECLVGLTLSPTTLQWPVIELMPADLCLYC